MFQRIPFRCRTCQNRFYTVLPLKNGSDGAATEAAGAVSEAASESQAMNSPQTTPEA
ncbi:MAG TPA: hypothetical protein VN736_05870 [Candidatus Limnocylindrales bacterium]|nr:hypothetical protein [Candidatus Limnocylindrales bacterium]